MSPTKKEELQKTDEQIEKSQPMQRRNIFLMRA
jgi:hypothetical protein